MTTSYNIYQQITSVRLSTVSNLAGRYFNGALNNGVGATLTASAVGSLVIDGVTAELGDRVLLISQTNTNENGIYVVQAPGGSFALWQLERAPDFQSIEQLKVGQYFTVGAGNTLAGDIYVVLEPLPSVIGLGTFTFANIPSGGGGGGGPFFAVANNFSEIASATALNQATENLGTGDGTPLTLTEVDFTAGQYFLTNPCPNLINVNCNIPGSYALILPPADGPQAFQLFAGPMVHNVGTQTLSVFASGGPFQPNIQPGDFQHILLIDNSSSSGLWQYQGIVTSVNGKTGDVVIGDSGGQTFYVSQDGVDQIGVTGGILNPCATLSFALSEITDASSVKPYQIIVETGVYTETNLALKPFIYIYGNNSTITVTNPVTLDAGWSAGGFASFQDFINSDFQGGFNLDFDAVGAPFSVMQLSNINGASNYTYTLNGSTSGTTIVVLDRLVGFAQQQSATITNCYGGLAEGALNNVTIIQNDAVNGHVMTTTNLEVLGNFSVTSSAGNLINLNRGLTAIGPALLSNTGTSSVASNLLDCSFLNTLTFNGDTNLVVNTKGLTVQPIKIGTPVVNYIELASTLNANYTPVNYTPLDETVTGNLAGIDNALANSAAQDLQDTYSTGNTAAINLEANRPIQFINANSVAAVNAITTPSTGINTVANNRVLGWTFIPSVNMLITALQYDNALFTGPSTRDVGIYVKGTQELLGSVTISNTDPLDGSGLYRTKVLDTPIQIFSGQQYVYATVTPANSSDHLNSDAVPNVNITVTERAELPASSAPIALQYPQSFTVDPNFVHVGSFQFSTSTLLEEVDINDTSSGGSVLMKAVSTTRSTHLLPSMSTVQRNAISSPAAGDCVFVTDSAPARPSVYVAGWEFLAYLSDVPGSSTLQSAYNAGNTIVIASNGNHIQMGDGTNNLDIGNDTGDNIVFRVTGTAKSSVPYAVMSDAAFASIGNVQGMIAYTTTSERLSIFDGMFIKQLAYTSDIPVNSTTINGMVINGGGGINAGFAIVGSHEIRVGNLVTGSLKITFNSQAPSPFFTITKTYGSAFTTANQAFGSGLVVKSPTAAIGDGVVTNVSSITSFGIRIDMNVASLSQNYILEAIFTYEVT